MRRVFYGLVLAAALTASPAKAGLTACNATSYVLYAAGAALNPPDLALKGWTRLVPGACAEVLTGDLSAAGYFLFARSSRAHSGPPRAWSGNANFCVRDKDFTLRQSFGGACPADAYEAGFAQIDTHHQKSWTATFRDTPDLGPMPAAAKAGLVRLAKDAGLKEAGDPKKFPAALAAFKARMHLAANAPDRAIFDALETEAMKSAQPAGYTLCNDTNSPAYAALGQQKGAVFSARGWWTLAAGSCSHLITDPIAGQKIWLRVERAKGAPLVTGPVNFCVTTIEFDIQGRENCQKRGLVAAGFMETNSKAAPGFTAHVTTTGLR